MWPAMAVGFGLFLTGTAFAYYMVLPRALLFFANGAATWGFPTTGGSASISPSPRSSRCCSALSFELPVVVMVFVKLGLLSYETMSKTRSYAIVAHLRGRRRPHPTPDVVHPAADGRCR